MENLENPDIIDLDKFSGIPHQWAISFQMIDPYMYPFNVLGYARRGRYKKYRQERSIEAALNAGATEEDLQEDMRLLGYMTVERTSPGPPRDPLGPLSSDQNGIMYEGWKIARVKLLYKMKGERSDPKNWRPVCLLDIASKILSSVIVKRAQVLYEQVGSDEQCGFRSGRGCADGIFNVMMALQKRKEHNLDSFVLFIDLIKAFDSISREALFEILRRYGMPDHFVNIIIRLHSDAKIKIEVGDQDIVVDSTIGVRQGSNEGPVLFLFFMLAVMETLEWPDSIDVPEFFTKADGGEIDTNQSIINPNATFKFRDSLFADDCGILFGGRKAIEAGANHFLNHLEDFGVHMHVARGEEEKSKTVAVFFPAKNSELVKEDVTGKIDMVDRQGKACHVHFEEKMKYLGVWIDSSLASDVEITERILAASKAYGALSQTLLSKQVAPTVKGKLFQTLVLSILMYGSECWSLTSSLKKRLTSFYNRCVRSMMRTSWGQSKAQRVTSVSLYERLGLKTFDQYIHKRILQWAGHVSRMPMSRLPRKFLNSAAPHPRPAGGLSASWCSSLNSVLDAVGCIKDTWMEQAADRLEWRAYINTL